MKFQSEWNRLLNRLHWNYLPEWCPARLRGCPQHWVNRRLSRECTTEICKENECLRHNSALVQPSEAGREVRPSSTQWGEHDGLPRLIDLGLVNFGVEVEHMHQAWPLTLEYGSDFGLEET